MGKHHHHHHHKHGDKHKSHKHHQHSQSHPEQIPRPASDDESEESEIDEEEAKQELEGFIVPDNEGDSSEGGRKRHKSKKGRKERRASEEELDEEELAMLEENTGNQIKRKQKKGGRLKKTTLVEGEDKGRSSGKESEGSLAEDDEFFRDSSEEEGEASRLNPMDAPSMQMAQKIFGEVPMLDDLPPVQEEREEVGEVHRSKKIEALFDPQEVKEMFASKHDDLIKQTDIPERMQLIHKERANTTPEDIDREAEWIFKKIIHEKPNCNEEAVKEKITIILTQYLKEYFDIPFIYTYRRNFFEQVFEKEDIWKIYNLDLEWEDFNKLYQSIRANLVNLKDLLGDEFQYIYEDLQTANTMTDLEDIQEFVIFYRRYLIPEEEEDRKRPGKRKDFLKDVIESRLDKMAKSFSISPAEFIQNLQEKRLRNQPPDIKLEPKIQAYEYVGAKFPSELDVLYGVTSYIARELGVQPYIRKIIRKFYTENVEVSTTPTDKGNEELDPFHPSFRVKHLAEKKLSSFKGDLWLDVKRCVEEQLIKVEFSIEKEKVNQHVSTLLEFFTPIEGNESKWKLVRSEALKVLISSLFPVLEAEAKRNLEHRATVSLVAHCAYKFREMLMEPPYKKVDQETVDGELVVIKQNASVFSFIMEIDESRRSHIHTAVLDPNGDLLETVIFQNLYLRKNRIETLKQIDRQLHDKDKEILKEMIERHKPGLMAVGASSLEARRLKEILEEEVGALNTSSTSSTVSTITVNWGNLTVPRIYSTSERGTRQLPNESIPIRQAISLGRYQQDPLSEIINLWDFETSKNCVLSIPLHPLQKSVNNAKLCAGLEIVAIDVINTIGVDINRVIDHPHLINPLSFVSALGPRKAHYLANQLRKQGKLGMRMELASKKLMGKNIFKNCIGFLKVKVDYGDDDIEHDHDVLDETRIHPEIYMFATKIAQEANEDKDIEEDENVVIKMIMKNPTKLEELDLDAYRDQLEKANQPNMRAVIDFVIRELTKPFSDPRPSNLHKCPSDELFYLLAGETHETFKIGMILPIKIIRIDENEATGRLENGLTTFLKKKDFLAEEDPKTLKDILHEMQVVDGRIKEIIPNNFRVEVTVNQQDLLNHGAYIEREYLESIGCKIEEKDLINKKIEAQICRPISRYQPRKITHKDFKNCSIGTAMQDLQNRRDGHYIFRPSSKGLDHLTLTIKLYSAIYTHIDIFEENKAQGANIGSRLRISDEIFDSLDEIIERYIMPLLKHIDEIKKDIKFKHCNSEFELGEFILQAKRERGGYIHYFFTFLKDYPQYLVLAYNPKRDNIIKEFIKIKPRGFYFHNEYHKSLIGLIAWFKKHFNEPTYQKYLQKIKDKKPIFTVSDLAEEKSADWMNINKDWGTQWGGEPEGKLEIPAATPFPPRTTYDENMKTDYGDRPMTDINDPNAGGFTSYGVEDSHGGYGGALQQTWGKEEHFKQPPRPSAGGWGGGGGGGDAAWGGSRGGSATRGAGYRGDRSGDRGGDRGGRGGGRGGEGGSTCYNCGQSGHFSRECPEPKKPRGGGDAGRGGGTTCYNCGESGHMSRECSQPKKERGGRGGGNRECYNCHKSGHMSYECTEQSSRGRGRGGGGGGGYRDRDRGGDSRGGFGSGRGGWGSNDDNSSKSTGGWGGSSSNKGWEAKETKETTGTIRNTSESGGWGTPSTPTPVPAPTSTEGGGWGNDNNKSTNKDPPPVETKISASQAEGAWGAEQPPPDSGAGGGANPPDEDKWGDQFNTVNNEPGIDPNPTTAATGGWGASTENNKGKEKNVEESKWGGDTTTKKPESTGTWGSDPPVAAAGNTEGGWGASTTSEPPAKAEGGWGSSQSNTQTSARGGWGTGGTASGGDRWGSTSDRGGRGAGTGYRGGGRGGFGGDRGDRGGRGGRGGGEGGGTCYNCGESGHFSRECPEPKKPRGGGDSFLGKRRDAEGGGITCYNCGESGHMSRECSQPRKERGGRGGGNRECYNCHKSGHMSYECTEQSSRGRGRGGGGDRDRDRDRGGYRGRGERGGYSNKGGGWGDETQTHTNTGGGWGEKTGERKRKSGGWDVKGTEQEEGTHKRMKTGEEDADFGISPYQSKHEKSNWGQNSDSGGW